MVGPRLTFDLQDQAHGATLVSVLHPHGVVAAVLLLGSDQGQDAHVAAEGGRGNERAINARSTMAAAWATSPPQRGRTWSR